MVVFVAIASAAVVGCGGGGDDPPDRTGSAAPTPTATPSAAVRLYDGIPQDGVRLGERDAPATLVEFADMQCPFCAQFSRDVLPTVVDDYVARLRIAYELRVRAFIGRDSVRAAGAAAAAARQDRLFQFADVFYRAQPARPENSGYVTNAFVRSIAEQVPGLDVDKVVAAANDPLAQPLVHRAQRLSEVVGSSGSPDFFLRRGRRMVPVDPDGLSVTAFVAALEAALDG